MSDTQIVCVACGKVRTVKVDSNTDIWACSKCRDKYYKEKISMKCDDCGKEFYITYNTYRMFNKEGKHWRCRGCNDKYRKSLVDNLPEAERNDYLTRKNAAIQDGWNSRSEDKKQETREKRLKIWENKTPEQRADHSRKSQQTWKNRSEENKRNQLNKMSRGRDKYWENEENWAYHHERGKNIWVNMTKEKFLEQCYNLAINSNNKPEDFTLASGNELKMLNNLKINNIKSRYIWYNTIKHSDFDKLFPYNPITDSEFISPYHPWDFKLDFPIGISILLDIDGSTHTRVNRNREHAITGKKYNMLDYCNFKDSQRPYQTDGMDAYIVECYDDKLTNDTPVYSFQTKEHMDYKQFMSLLQFMNTSSKEVDELSNSSI